MEYDPGIRGTRQGPQLPGELVHGMWGVKLLYTGTGEDRGDQQGNLTEGGGSPELADIEREALRKLLVGYSGPQRDDLEALADTLGISANQEQTDQNRGGSPSSPSHEPGKFASQGKDSVDDTVVQTELEKSGVIDSIPTAAFKEWYGEKSRGTFLGTILSSKAVVRTLAFLALQEDVQSFGVEGVDDDDDVTKVSALMSSQDVFDTEAQIGIARFNAGDGFQPDEDNCSGLWKDDFPLATWFVSSTLYPESEEMTQSIHCSTTIDIGPSGVDGVHTDVSGESGHFREVCAIRQHQLELTEQVLERHVESSGPFSLSAKTEFSQYHSAVDYRVDMFDFSPDE
ncbi:hypothetical protein ACERIT_08700 [Halopenitus sp. H-Gu1]|uniref:hypothetical protein n=1 Tax=Halopenitus sp. H-Gu1 TaxID=3242697 RepID=UPI00359DF4E0